MDVINTPKGHQIRKLDLLRVIRQALDDLGFCDLSREIGKTESNAYLHHHTVNVAKKFLEKKDFDRCISSLAEILHAPVLGSVIALIRELEYFELIKDAKYTEALDVLRTHLVHLVSRAQFVELAGLLLNSNPTFPLDQNTCWNEIINLLPSDVYLENRKLLSLMDEVILYRNQNCKCDARHKKMHENNPFLLLGPHQCKVVKYEMNCVQIFQRHTSEVIQAEFSYDGTMIASVDKKGVFIVWTIVNLGNSNLSENGDADEKGDSIQAENFFQESYMEHLCYPGEFHKVKDVKWSNDDNYIAIIFSNQIVLLEWRSKKRKAMILPISEGLSSVAWLNNSKNFVTSSLDEHMILWDIEGTKISVWETPMVEEICISRSETLIYASADTNIHVYDSKSKKFLYSLNEKQRISTFSMASSKNQLLASVTNPCELHLWDLDEMSILMRFSGFKQTKFVLKPTFVGELNSFVCSGSEDSMIYIWDAENGDLLQKIAGHSGVVNSVRWTDCNGGMLLSASDDGTIRLWRFKQDVVVDTRNEG